MEVVLSLTSLSFLNLFLKSLSSKTSFIWSEFLFWSLIWDFGLEVSLGVGGFKFSSVPGAVPVSLSLSFFFFFHLFIFGCPGSSLLHMGFQLGLLSLEVHTASHCSGTSVAEHRL